jgi:hypothetical protein
MLFSLKIALMIFNCSASHGHRINFLLHAFYRYSKDHLHMIAITNRLAKTEGQGLAFVALTNL